MGCEKSKCCKDHQSEVEVDIETDLHLLQQQRGSKRIPPLPLKDRDLCYSPTKHRDSPRDQYTKASMTPEHESTKNTKWEAIVKVFF